VSFSKTVISDLRKVKMAQDVVRGVVGEVEGDSAGQVYRIALKRLGHDIRGLDEAAAIAMWPTLRHHDRRGRVAMDSAQTAEYKARFPGIDALKQR
jgi:hypothetical protein